MAKNNSQGKIIKGNKHQISTTARKKGARVASIVVPAALSLGLAFSLVFGPKYAKSCNSEAVKPPKGTDNIDTVPDEIIDTYFEEPAHSEPFYTEETVDFDEDSSNLDYPTDAPATRPSVEPDTVLPRPLPDIMGGVSTDVEEPTIDIDTPSASEPIVDEPIIDEPVEEIGAKLAEILQTLTDNIRLTNHNSTIVISSIENFKITKAEEGYNIDLILGGTMGKTQTRYTYFMTPASTTSQSAAQLFERSADQTITIGEYISLLHQTLTDSDTKYSLSKGRDKIAVNDAKVVEHLLNVRRAEIEAGSGNIKELATLNKLILHPEKAEVQVYSAICDDPLALEYHNNAILNYGDYSYQFNIEFSGFEFQPTREDLDAITGQLAEGSSNLEYSVSTALVNNSIYDQLLKQLQKNNELGLN